MLSIVYLVAAAYLGDLVCRPFCRFLSVQHRIAAGFLVGLLLSTWATFLAAILFCGSSHPLIAANIAFALVFGALVLAARLWPIKNIDEYVLRPPGRDYW